MEQWGTTRICSFLASSTKIAETTEPTDEGKRILSQKQFKQFLHEQTGAVVVIVVVVIVVVVIVVVVIVVVVIVVVVLAVVVIVAGILVVAIVVDLLSLR